jgi:cyclic beta-1,2-glucan synthetase
VARYVAATGDRAILDEEVPFLEGRPIPRDSEGIVFLPRPSRDRASLYEHCRRAIAFTLERMGPNGLPLLGAGDWNDGLSEAGRRHRGESVWLGFFLHDVLCGFARLAATHESSCAAARYVGDAERLRERLERMWRGDRYVRVTTDDGEELSWPDALTGSWPTLSGAVDLERGCQAVEGTLAFLEQEDLVLVLTPPFTEASPVVPGRIAHYPPGVRENGGQYSHGSSWLVDALVRLAETARAEGDDALAARLRARAFTVWSKISPLDKTGPERLDIYGLPPHQQPADIYFGPGYEGRGGWSWYTGAAARMLTAGHAMLGLTAESGELRQDAAGPATWDGLRLRRVLSRGRVVRDAAEPTVPAE